MKAAGRTIMATAAAAAALAAITTVHPAAAGEFDRAGLAQVRQSTEQYHDVEAAIDDGYELLDVCFSDPEAGGMGIHYLKGIDATVDADHPEALVYQVTDHGPKLVAVEYIVPLSLSADAPEVLGQHLHANTDLGLWVLHAWIWKGNPAGMFEDFNPNVPQCS